MKLVDPCDLRRVALNTPQTVVAKAVYALGIALGLMTLAGIALQ